METTHSDYPFQIEAIFFDHINISRAAQVDNEPGSFQLKTEIGLGLRDEKDKIQVNFRVKTPGEISGEVDVNIVCISLVTYLGDTDISDEEFAKYINDHLLIAMSSRIIQMLAILTAQMGMPPVWMPHPRGFQLPVEVLRDLHNQLVDSSG